MREYAEEFLEFMKADGNWKLFVAGFLMSFGGRGFLGAIWVGLVAASCLEYKDKSHGSIWSWKDWILVVSGSFLGALLLTLL